MLGSFKSCWTSLHREIKLCFRQLKKLDKASPYKRSRKLNRLGSNGGITSSFANMEVSDQFRQVFKLIDANGDGKISLSELSEVLVSLGRYDKSKAAEEAEVMLKLIDYNGDGYIDLDEFLNVVDVDGGNGGEDYLVDAFLIFDTDKNGKISDKELRRVLINLGCGDYSLEDCRRMIERIDRDGDGFVDFEEFQSMMSRHPTRCV